MTSPFRDENESLRMENERLHRALASQAARWNRVRRRPRAAVAMVAVDFGAIVLLRPWLNGSDDFHFWLAVGVLVSLAVLALFFALGPRDRNPS